MNRQQLARKLEKHHAKSKSWQKTAEAFPFISKGLANMIVNDDYDPADKKLREYYKMPPRTCPKCKRKETKPRTIKAKPISGKGAMSPNELLWALENRVVIQ